MLGGRLHLLQARSLDQRYLIDIKGLTDVGFHVQISPTTLFLIEGTGQSWSGAMCWGDGFITDRKKIDASGMSDPNPFFLQLITKPYVYNVVIAPHYYPPSISHSTACYTGTCLYE